MPYMDLEAARKEMRRNGVDALIATTPSSFCYTSSYHRILEFLPGVTIIPADSTLEPVLIVSKLEERMAAKMSYVSDIRTYPVWTEIVDVEDLVSGNLTRIPKKYQPDPYSLITFVSDVLREKGLDDATLGVEMGSLSHSSYLFLLEKNPKARFLAAEEILAEFQRVKTEDGIQALRTAAAIGVKGIQGVIDKPVLGATIGELQLRYRNAVLGEITEENALRFSFYNPIGIAAGDPFSSLGSTAHKVLKGDAVFFDCGIIFNGHMSDMGRTFVVGKTSPLQEKIYRALRAGFDEAVSRMRPGIKLKEIFNAAQETIRKNGLDWYTRGHLGHSIGIFPHGEQPPFIHPGEDSELEPNMVMCIETPLYVNGFGAFQIEDMVLITADGHEVLTDLSRNLLEL